MEHQLYFTKPAACFEEAFPLGNGSLGAMIYGGVEQETFTLNHDSLWSGKPTYYEAPEAYEAFCTAREKLLAGPSVEAECLLEEKFQNMWAATYLPLGKVTLSRSIGEWGGYRRTLTLKDAVARAEFTDGAAVRNETFVSYPDGCLVFREYSEVPREYVLAAASPLLSSVRLTDHGLLLTGRCPVHGRRTLYDKTDHPYDYTDEDGIRFALGIRVLTDGIVEPDGDSLRVRGAGTLTLLITAATSFVDYRSLPDAPYLEPCTERLAQAARLGADALLARHRADYMPLYDRCALDLHRPASDLPTDERLGRAEEEASLTELLFHYGRYLAIASSRPGSQCANLSGLWNEHLFPAWYSNHTININIQMIYSPMLPCNLPECCEPLVMQIRHMADTGTRTAWDYYRARGFAAHSCTDIWAHTIPIGGRNIRTTSKYSFWNMGGAWLAQELFRIWEYTADRAFLAETAYPILKSAALFCLDLLIEHDGRLILSPAVSPENAFLNEAGEICGIAASTTMTQSIVYELFRMCAAAADELNTDAEFRRTLRERMQRLDPVRITSDGRLLEWDAEYREVEITHRHVSHLYGLTPGELMTAARTPALADACRRSLEVRGDDGTTWSLSWKSQLWSKLRDGEHAYSILLRQLRPAESRGIVYTGAGGSYPNLLSSCPPFVLDGNMGAANAIAMMLLLCEDGEICLLPALPSAYASGSVRGLRAKGNVTVSMEWENGICTRAVLSSPIPQTVSVRMNGELRTAVLRAGENTVLTKNTDK